MPPHTAARSGSPTAPPWNDREIELLTVTLKLLHESGYDRLTIDNVAAHARASKATVYRRWPTKADLVIAAITHSLRITAVSPHTGSLRDDLLTVADLITRQATLFGGTLAAVLPELRRNAAMRSVIERGFLDERRPLMQDILRRAAERGEIDSAKVDTEMWDVLPGYLIYRFLIPGRPVTAETTRMLVDQVLLPSLTAPE